MSPTRLIIALLWACVVANTASAQEQATVRIDGRPVFRVGPQEGQNASERATRIERRLGVLAEHPGEIGPIRIETRPGRPSDRIISASGVTILTIGPADSEENLQSVDDLSRTWAAAIETALDRSRDRRVSWGRFLTEVQASVRQAFSRVGESAITIIPRLLAAVMVLALFWFLAAGVRLLLRLLFRSVISDLTIESLIKQSAFYFIWLLGLLVAFHALGLDPATVITALGLGSIALGFALKDILSNLVSGILMLLLRPFEIGDQIIVGETEGKVERVRLRATHIRTYDGRLVLVPNAEIFTSRVTNNTASPIRRGTATLFLGYDADLRAALDAIRKGVENAEGVIEGEPVQVRIADLGQDDLEIDAQFWTDSRRSDFMSTTSRVRRSILEALVEAKIPLPDPDTRFIIHKGSDQTSG